MCWIIKNRGKHWTLPSYTIVKPLSSLYCLFQFPFFPLKNSHRSVINMCIDISYNTNATVFIFSNTICTSIFPVVIYYGNLKQTLGRGVLLSMYLVCGFEIEISAWTLYAGLYCVLHINFTTVWGPCCSVFKRYYSQCWSLLCLSPLPLISLFAFYFIMIHFTWLCISLLLMRWVLILTMVRLFKCWLLFLIGKG